MGRLDDGFATLITFALKPSVKFYEKTVTPPGRDGGGGNPTFTMRSTKWRTQSPKKLKTMTPMTGKVAYDTVCEGDVDDMINQNQLITVTYPDGSSDDFYGWLDKFIPDEIVEGAQPTATITVEPSMQDADGVETDPVYHPAP